MSLGLERSSNGKLLRKSSDKLVRKVDAYDVVIDGIELDNSICCNSPLTIAGASGSQYTLSSPVGVLSGEFKIRLTPPFNTPPGAFPPSDCNPSFDEYRTCLSVHNTFEATFGDSGAGLCDDSLGPVPAYLQMIMYRSAPYGDATTYRLFIGAVLDPITRFGWRLFDQTLIITPGSCGVLVFDSNIFTDFYNQLYPVGSCLEGPLPGSLFVDTFASNPRGKNGTVTLTPCSSYPDCGLRHITSVTSTGTATIIIQFDDQVSLDDFGLKLAFNINSTYFLVTGTGVQLSSTQIEFDVDGAYTPATGDTWNLTDQPEWLRNVSLAGQQLMVVAHPASGTVL